jgi:hypothetical protein
VQRRHQLAWLTTLIGVAVAVIGIAVLFVYSLSEVMADPTLTLEDGYWIGRLPWTPIGVDLTVIGATVVLVFGAVTAWFAGGLIRRAVTLLAVAVGAFWWAVVTVPLVGMGGASCPTCPPRGPEPLTMAYSLPQQTVMWLILPAVVVTLIAIRSLPGRPPSGT